MQVRAPSGVLLPAQSSLLPHPRCFRRPHDRQPWNSPAQQQETFSGVHLVVACNLPDKLRHKRSIVCQAAQSVEVDADFAQAMNEASTRSLLA